MAGRPPGLVVPGSPSHLFGVRVHEVDETFIGGVKTGEERGRGAPEGTHVVIAFEAREKGFGPVPAAGRGEDRRRAPRGVLAPQHRLGAVVVSDAPWSYPLAIADTFGHKPFNIKRSGRHAHESLPGRIAWRACSSAGSQTPTSPASPSSTCRPTWTSSPSGSTAVPRAPVLPRSWRVQ